MSDSERGRLLPPDLDDRTWKDLVADARALISTYAPQWTDHNPSDVGMTLIELFAFLVEGLTYKLNRVPDKNYIAFLNLIGVTRQPKTPARAFLVFTAAPGALVTVKQGTQAQTAANESQPAIRFETDEDVQVLPTNMKAALQLAKTSYANLSDCFATPPGKGEFVVVPTGQSGMLALGFDKSVAQEIRLRVRLSRPLPIDPGTHQAVATLAFLCSQGAAEPASWPALAGVVDGTAGLTQDGDIRLTLPAAWASQVPTAWTSTRAASDGDKVDTPLFWLGLRIANASSTDVTVGIDAILFNAASASNALTIAAPEALGTSTGNAFQVFALKSRPLFKQPDTDTPYDHLVVTVDGVPWTQVDEFDAGPGNWYSVDPVAGEVQFGNYDDKASPAGHGSVPPVGAVVVATSYRYVDSDAGGNVSGGSINQMRSLVQNIVGVVNVVAASGGTNEEDIEDTKRRGPQELRNRYRAVTADDYEHLAREATADVAIVRCLAPRMNDAAAPNNSNAWAKGDPWAFGGIERSAGNVHVIVVPDQGPLVPQPQPGDELLRTVRRYLDQRRPLTATLTMHGPLYVPISVTVEISLFQSAIDSGVLATDVYATALASINAVLHPVHGLDGDGWQVGQPVVIADIFKAIAPTADIGYVSNLTVTPQVPSYHTSTQAWDDRLERPFPLAPGTATVAVRLADYELVCAASNHAITTPILAT